MKSQIRKHLSVMHFDMFFKMPELIDQRETSVKWAPSVHAVDKSVFVCTGDAED